MTRRERLLAWFAEASNLRRFALWNIWLWSVQHPIVLGWMILAPASFAKWGVLYVAQLSVAALWLLSLAWWQSTRVEERQIEAEA